MLKFRYNGFFLILLLLPFVFFIGGAIPYFLLYILLLSYIVPLTHCFLGFIFIKGRVTIPNTIVYSGEYVNLKYEIENTSIFPMPNIEIENEIGSKLSGKRNLKQIISLDKKQIYKKEENILVSKRGSFSVGEIVISVKDIFGIISIEKKLTTSISLTVYPQIINLEYFSILGSQQIGDLIINENSFEDRSRINSIRDYTEGDNIKDIHWKLSAKKGDLLVKEFENRGDIGTEIFINNYSNYFAKDIDNKVEDKIVESAISIVNYCLERNINILLSFFSYDKKVVIEGQNSSDIKAFLESLAKFKANASHDYLSNIGFINYLDKNSNIIFISPILDRRIGSQAIDLKMKKYNLIYILITDNKDNFNYIDKDIESQLINEGIPIYIVDVNSNLKDVLEVAYGKNI